MIGIFTGISLGGAGVSKRIALKDNNPLDYINTGITAQENDVVNVWGRFTDISTKARYWTGAFESGQSNRFYFGTSNENWYFGLGDSAVEEAIPADTELHKFTIIGKSLYIDDILIRDRSAAVWFGSGSVHYIHNVDLFSSDFSAKFQCSKVTINSKTFTPHKDGYYVDELGNPYYNRGEASNLYPLEVIEL